MPPNEITATSVSTATDIDDRNRRVPSLAPRTDRRGHRLLDQQHRVPRPTRTFLDGAPLDRRLTAHDDDHRRGEGRRYMRMKCLIISSATSKSAMTPSRSGRMAAMLPGCGRASAASSRSTCCGRAGRRSRPRSARSARSRALHVDKRVGSAESMAMSADRKPNRRENMRPDLPTVPHSRRCGPVPQSRLMGLKRGRGALPPPGRTLKPDSPNRPHADQGKGRTGLISPGCRPPRCRRMA